MTAQLSEHASVLHSTVDDLAALFGSARVVTDEQQASDPLPVPRSFVWTYQVAMHASPDAQAVLVEQVEPRMAAAGWQVTNRDTERAFAVHFGRDGFDVGVLIGRSERAEIVVGGSTPDVAVD